MRQQSNVFFLFWLITLSHALPYAEVFGQILNPEACLCCSAQNSGCRRCALVGHSPQKSEHKKLSHCQRNKQSKIAKSQKASQGFAALPCQGQDHFKNNFTDDPAVISPFAMRPIMHLEIHSLKAAFFRLPIFEAEIIRPPITA
ncbi:MAG: hypothetical protein H7A33_05285 [Deltaproteobacteria bacterium]|nr:hypothetical protein [Deltaproteobacteria bacterium]